MITEGDVTYEEIVTCYDKVVREEEASLVHRVLSKEENPLGSMKEQARAAGLSVAEVEKISTCPLVKLLVGQREGEDGAS